MPRYKLTIEYAGTRYSGWQIQTNARTIQGELVKAVRDATGRDRFEVYGAGRTDAGVHALAQVAHLDVGTSLPPATLLARINDALPADIHVRTHRGGVAPLPRPPRRHGARLPVPDRAAPHRVRQAVRLVGPRSARRRGGCAPAPPPSPACRTSPRSPTTIPRRSRRRWPSPSVTVEEAGALVLVRVVGSHFLWKMVRRMVGLLVGVGTGAIDRREIGRALTSRSDLPATLTAPASGLFLEFVTYGDALPTPAAPFAID